MIRLTWLHIPFEKCKLDPASKDTHHGLIPSAKKGMDGSCVGCPSNDTAYMLPAGMLRLAMY
jgi:hypothetical protein